MNIPKHIFLIWIGDIVPSYVYSSLQLYKSKNIGYNIELIHVTFENINNIYNEKYDNFKYKTELKQSIDFIFDKLFNKYINFINEQKRIYGRNIRFIQILSDVFRLHIINTYGGIYVDCDTIPLRSFDDIILSYNAFTVSRYYLPAGKYNIASKYSNIYIDNYFFGSNSYNKIYDFQDKALTKLLQTNNNFEYDIGYLYRKKLFYQNNIAKIYENLKLGQDVSNFYIEHYHANSWKIFNKKDYSFNTYKCIYDKYLKYNI